MATDVDVQFFSHLNGLILGNNWGDLIRLLDKTLVTGIEFTQITAASIDEQGDVHINLYSAHNAMLFQVVELTGFAPASFNQKYRIKGVPNTTQLILKPHTAIAETSITTVGAGKLASLGYDIIFRDANDVKRVYRAKNPSAQHPFIRVDESLASDTGSYTSTYAKFAMVGLLEHMDHIDDYENPDVLQLPFDPADPVKNWKITGTGTGVIRGWSRWYWAASRTVSGSNIGDTSTPPNLSREFNLFGGPDNFYLITQVNTNNRDTLCLGCGLYEEVIDSSIIYPWFLTTVLYPVTASESWQFMQAVGCTPFVKDTIATNRVSDTFLITSFNELDPIKPHALATPIVPDSYSGRTNLYPSGYISALEVPFYSEGRLRGVIPHILYAGKTVSGFGALLSGNHMYLTTPVGARPGSGQNSGYYIYLGELE
jgi:hypothetical protein